MPRPEVEVLSEFGWKYGNTQFLRGVTDVGNLKIAAPFDATEEAENERITRITYGELFSAFTDPMKVASRANVPPAILLSVMESIAQRKAERVFRKREDGTKVGRVPEMFYDDLAKSVSNKEIKARDRLMTAVCVSVSTRNSAWIENNPDVPTYAKEITKRAVDCSTRANSDKVSIVHHAKIIASMIPSEEQLDEIENTKSEEYKTEAEEALEAAEAAAEELKKIKEAGGKIDTETTERIKKEKLEAEKAAANDTTRELWYPMEVIKPPLETTKKMHAMEKKNSFLRDSGRRIVRISRALTDGRVFRANKKKKMAGTILIDDSGSMGLSPAMVEEIIMNSPGTTVAIYSGGGEHGKLVVVASNSKVASTKAFQSLGGNDVDGPALEWLGRQQEPRVWVSDGQVVGQGDTRSCHQDVARIRAKCRIKWLDTKQYGRSSAIIDETIKALLKGNFKDGGDTLKSNYSEYF